MKKMSLRTKLLACVLAIALLLAAVSVGVSYYLYSRTMDTHYKTLSSNLTHSTAALLDSDTVAAFTQQVLEIYRAQCPAADVAPDFDSFTEADWAAYYAAFAPLEQTDAYQSLAKALSAIRENNAVRSLYLIYLDVPTQKGIYLLDVSAAEDRCAIGHCDGIEEELASVEANGGNIYEVPAHITNYEEYGWLSTSSAPIYDAQGEVVADVYVDISMNDIVQGKHVFFARLLALLAAVTAALAAAAAYGATRTIVQPIDRLSRAASDFVAARRDGRTAESYAQLQIRTGDEIEKLADSFVKMDEELNSYIEDLAAVTAEKKRIGAELSLAAHIQADMLPCVFPPFPDRTEFDVYASMTPAKEVGGDFYDFFLIDSDHLAIVMADVSGKGVPAALFMMISKTLIKSAAQAGLSPAQVLEKANRQLCENNKAEMFVTVWLGVLEISTGKLCCANAGHEFPAVQRAGGEFALFKDRHGFVVAGMPGVKYREYTLELAPGDAVFVYTDGVPEATNAALEMYGTQRMIAALNRAPDANGRALLQAVHEDVDAFVGDADQFDDLTMLCLRLNRTVPTLTLAPTADSMASAQDFFEQALQKAGAPQSVITKMNIAVDEIYSNIVRYSGATAATLRCETERNAVRLLFADNGKPYDPTQTPEPDVTLDAQQREIGGLGIFMVRKMMDDVRYEYADGQNRLTLEKRWS